MRDQWFSEALSRKAAAGSNSITNTCGVPSFNNPYGTDYHRNGPAHIFEM